MEEAQASILQPSQENLTTSITLNAAEIREAAEAESLLHDIDFHLVNYYRCIYLQKIILHGIKRKAALRKFPYLLIYKE